MLPNGLYLVLLGTLFSSLWFSNALITLKVNLLALFFIFICTFLELFLAVRTTPLKQDAFRETDSVLKRWVGKTALIYRDELNFETMKLFYQSYLTIIIINSFYI